MTSTGGGAATTTATPTATPGDGEDDSDSDGGLGEITIDEEEEWDVNTLEDLLIAMTSQVKKPTAKTGKFHVEMDGGVLRLGTKEWFFRKGRASLTWG